MVNTEWGVYNEECGSNHDCLHLHIQVHWNCSETESDTYRVNCGNTFTVHVLYYVKRESVR